MSENEAATAEGMRYQFPDGIKFKYTWRKYQKRVLNELEEHLEDNHLHIVAPPGSGKTILGLEVAIRLDKPTLILAPTIAIRNQWIQRLLELFLQTDQTPSWISRDIRNPKFLTVATYQSLHAVYTADQSSGDNSSHKMTFLQSLRDKNVGTILLDEAHHLKNAWWESLTSVKSDLNATIVGLTATPPYDVSYQEWQRYVELNGPVDTEISVPELVVEGDLCPHQDYVLFTYPTAKEAQKLFEYRDRIEHLYQDILNDQELIEAIEKHPFYVNPGIQLEEIYKTLEIYSSMLVFLWHVGKAVTKEHIEVIGDKKFEIPKMSYEWLEILLTFYLYQDPQNFSNYQDHQEKLKNRLKRNGAKEHRTICLKHNNSIHRLLSSSISKLEGINKIVQHEYENLTTDLRLVILTDFIRKEFLSSGPVNEIELNKIGVIPIFEKVRRSNPDNIKLGVLTGSIIIIPVDAFEPFREVAQKFNIRNIRTTPLSYDSRYLEINLNDQLRHDIVHIVTKVFEQGHIQVLIGTKSLLGEGWDAPSVNALILASFVGSFVLSNQMRGRAIRAEKTNVNKTGNIWHIACVDPTDPAGGEDVSLLQRRFRAFVGVSSTEDSIENGLNRLGIPENLQSQLVTNELNELTFRSSNQRKELQERWANALANGVSLVEEIKVPFPKDKNYQKITSLYYNRTIANVLATLASALISFGEEAMTSLSRSLRSFETIDDFQTWVMIMGGIGMIFFGRRTFLTFRAYVKYRDITLDIRHIADALLSSLIHIGSIQTNKSRLKINVEIDEFGSIYCNLTGGSTFEKSLFIKSLEEIISAVDNPRYIIIRKSFFLTVLAQKDFHSVPEIIGRKKKFAQHFESQWRNFVGKCELVYTRTIEGRKLLLKSRIESLASLFQEKPERINKWR